MLLLPRHTTTISYQPVTIDVRHLWTLFIGTPHNLASDVGLLIDQQKNFSTLLVIIIAANRRKHRIAYSILE